MRYLKKILMIILNNGTRFTYSIPEGKTDLEVYKSVSRNGDFNEQDIKDVLYFPHTLYNLEEFQYYYDEDTKVLDEKPIAINFKVDEFRKQRSLLFKNLDMEFMKSLENPNCPECAEKIVNIKKYFRELPEALSDYLEEKKVEEITKFNCFNNVFHIFIINGGSGYTEAPEITISEPDTGESTGFQLKAEAIISEGKVTDIKTIQVGSNYIQAPSVSISKPENGNVATAIASEPENDIVLTQRT